jgi:hypothetical protein
MDERDIEMEAGSEGLSRRTLIKRAGIGAAVVWATPVLTSVGLGAASGSPACGPTCDATCLGLPICGQRPGGGQLDLCACSMDDLSGDCFCWQNQYCSTLESCSSTKPCPSGWGCVVSCCGDSYCFPPCGTAPTASEASASGLTGRG